MRHIISILMQNEAGALARVAAMFSSRGYNIESLSVAPTEDSQLSRLTLVTTGSDDVIEQINKQLHKLVDVVNTADMTLDDHIERELLLIKVAAEESKQGVIENIIESFNVRVLDDRLDCYTLELTGITEQVDDFIAKLAENSEIMAVVRSGAMAISHGRTVLGSRF